MQHDEVLATVREIVRVHTAFWESSRAATLDWLPDHDQMWREGFEEHWPGFAAEYGVRLGRMRSSWESECGRIWIGSSSESPSAHRH